MIVKKYSLSSITPQNGITNRLLNTIYGEKGVFLGINHKI